MARVAGADIPDAKRVEIALTYIYGIGRTRSTKILDAAGVSPDIRAAMSTNSNPEGGYTTAPEYMTTVLATQALYCARKTDAGTRTIRPLTRSGGANYNGSNVNLADSYLKQRDFPRALTTATSLP